MANFRFQEIVVIGSTLTKFRLPIPVLENGWILPVRLLHSSARIDLACQRFPLTYYHQHPQAFSPSYLRKLYQRILACPYFVVNNLNRDFVGTKGFSVVFRRSHLATVAEHFPYFQTYLNRVLQPECNAFYLNPLLLQTGSRVDPHIDRSLRSYCKTINPPDVVSVLYVQVPNDLVGGELILRSRKGQVGKITPTFNTLVFFQGDLTHSVNPVTSSSTRLSLVCEQYNLEEAELEDIPEFRLESRLIPAEGKPIQQRTRKLKS